MSTVPTIRPEELPAGFTVEYGVPLDSLVAHPRNPRKGNLAKIRESIRVHGFVDVVVAQTSTRHMLHGNHRAKAAGLEGYTHAPLVIWADVDDEQALAMLLAYNRSADEADYDRTMLLEVLRDLDLTTHGLEGTLYDASEIEDLRRLTGEVGREATDFLARYVEESAAAGSATPELDAVHGIGPGVGQGMDRVYSLTFGFDASQRERLLEILGYAKRETGNENSADVLFVIVEEWFANRIDGAAT